MYPLSIICQARQSLVVQFAELQKLRNRVLEAEQRMLGRRRASRQPSLGRARLSRGGRPGRRRR
jgi:hypothetical protein